MPEELEATLPPICEWFIDGFVPSEMGDETRVAVGEGLGTTQGVCRALRAVALTTGIIVRFAGYRAVDSIAGVYQRPKRLLAGAQLVGNYVFRESQEAASGLLEYLEKALHLAAGIGSMMALIAPGKLAMATGLTELEDPLRNTMLGAFAVMALVVPLLLAARDRPRSVTEWVSNPWIEKISGVILAVLIMMFGITGWGIYQGKMEALSLDGAAWAVTYTAAIVGFPCLLYQLSKYRGRFRVVAALIYALIMGAGVGALVTMGLEASRTPIGAPIPSSGYDTPASQWFVNCSIGALIVMIISQRQLFCCLARRLFSRPS